MAVKPDSVRPSIVSNGTKVGLWSRSVARVPPVVGTGVTRNNLLLAFFGLDRFKRFRSFNSGSTDELRSLVLLLSDGRSR